MTPHTAPPVEFTPVFDWSPPRRRRMSLAGFIVGSAALHAFCFYLFQIIYPPTVALLPPPARVNVITGNSEDGRLLLRWIESEDPALSSTTQRPPNAPTIPLPGAAHVPSYANYQPALRIPPAPPRDLTVPSAQPPAPVPIARQTPAGTPVVTPTAIEFGNEGEILGAATVPALKFHSTSAEAPQAAQFRIAVCALGDVRYCFLESSSGDAALDDQARSYLMQVRFPPREDPKSPTESLLSWTTATIEWGNDISTPAAPGSSATPKP